MGGVYVKLRVVIQARRGMAARLIGRTASVVGRAGPAFNIAASTWDTYRAIVEECPEKKRTAILTAGLSWTSTLLVIGAILAALQTTSRMTAFRKLSELGYLSSYSHSGGYYTLQSIPQFDGDGLWLFEGVGFSRHGTLKDTVAILVDRAESGQLHRELQERLQVRVHNTLLGLVQGKRVAREIVDDEYLYVSADPARGSAQLARRRERGSARGAGMPPPAALALEILLDIIQAARLRCDAKAIAARLTARGVVVTVDQVRDILRQYDLPEKKTRSPSARSRR